MKRLSIFLLVFLLFSIRVNAQQQSDKPIETVDVAECVKDFTRHITKRFDYIKAVLNHEVSVPGRTIKGSFAKYSVRIDIDTTITNFALFELYDGINGKFLILTVVKNGITEVFIDLDFNGTLDQYLSNKENVNEKDPESHIKDYILYIDFGAHG